MGERGSENLKKGIILVFIANLINLCISLVNGFILPKYLSVETFADIKTYQLYANYIGILHLGYADGVYLFYGGKNIRDISGKDINITRTNLLLFQSLMTVIFCAVGVILQDRILVVAALTIIPFNIASAFKNILQATGEFKTYSGIMNYTSVLTFIGTMILLFVVRTDNSLYYFLVMGGVTFIVWGMLERKIISTYGFKIQLVASLHNLIENIKSGIVLMLGNFSSILMTSIDRWFVKFLLTTTDFAFYSFVVSTENLIAVFINPIVTTMYNYICVTTDFKAIRRIKRMCLISSLFLIASAFPAKFILEVYLTKYLQAQYVLFILFSTEVFFMVIKGIYVNIYKARKQQNIYFKQLLISIALGCVLNTLFYLVFRSNEGIALATLLSVICWYAICCASVEEVRPDFKEIAILFITIPSYILFGFFMPATIGFLLYIVVVVVSCLVFMKNDMISLVNVALGTVKKKLKR